MFRALRPPGWFVQRDIQLLIRSFPSERIRITRQLGIISVSAVGHPEFANAVIYEGEALVCPAGGSAESLGLGEIEQTSPVLLIYGWHDVRQGDFCVRTEEGPGGVLLPDCTYIVSYPASAWRHFQTAALSTFQQGT